MCAVFCTLYVPFARLVIVLLIHEQLKIFLKLIHIYSSVQGVEELIINTLI